MRPLIAFINKEFTEAVRTGKFLILTILFVVFGVMNPAIAKLTPWLMEAMAGSLGDAGLIVTEVRVDALTSWTQFYKNIPIALIVFLLMFSGILTTEYQRGTLINMVTKGLRRWQVIISKTFVLLTLWTLGYWMCFGVTYAYNAYFWDNSILSHLGFSAACYYLAGAWLITLLILTSALFRYNSTATLTTGAVFVLFYLLGLLHDFKKYVPTQLINSMELLTGTLKVSETSYALTITLGLSFFNVIAAIILFNKKTL